MAWLGRFCAATLLLTGCAGNTGDPAAPYALTSQALDATVTTVEASLPVQTAALTGNVVRSGSDAAVAGAVVIVEVGGSGEVNPASIATDGAALSTILVDPYIRFGTVTGDAGTFAFPAVPVGSTGIHVLEPSYGAASETVALTATSAAASVGLSRTQADGGAPPSVTGLTVTPSIVAPLTQLTFTVRLAAGSMDDALSADAYLFAPFSGFAGVLAPPTPAVAGGPYPDGVYNRALTAPSTVGVYTYLVVASSLHKNVSVVASVVLTVTPNGLPPTPEGGLYDGDVFPEGGLPDGRR